MAATGIQYGLFTTDEGGAESICGGSCLQRVGTFPQLRFMGSKYRLLPWLHHAFHQLEFDTVLDAFAGSGCVSYLLKAMGKQVLSNDFLQFSATISEAIVENSGVDLDTAAVERLTAPAIDDWDFIARTFDGIFYTAADLQFLDAVWSHLRRLQNPYRRAIAIAALIRSCVKRQPRGVFTVSGDPERYKDGRRDLRLSLKEHFIEQVGAYNRSVFANGRAHRSRHGDVFEIEPRGFDLVYLDPPYVPRADDNCYVKRYHFLEGLSCYWENLPVRSDTQVKKIAKRYTPFSYRRDCLPAFERLFAHFERSILVLSYSSNGYPDLDVLVDLMRRHKQHVSVLEKPHRYHFGTHDRVRRSVTKECLLIGR
jgi:adenine-specific DNA-methyltransferase